MSTAIRQPNLRFVPIADWVPRENKSSDEHKNLYHYTNISALRSIIQNNELWATSFRELNDYTEILLFKEPLKDELFDALKTRLLTLVKEKPLFRQKIERHYGSILNASRKESEQFIELLYKTTFGEIESYDSFYPLFVISFCTHDSDSPYEQENGLLSQWRSYGAEGGVAIVFNTKDLESAFSNEHSAYLYNILGIGSVIYSHNTEEIEQYVRPITDAIGHEFLAMYSDEKPQLDQIFGPFIVTAARYKHRAFFEEREVRLYASPTPAHIISKDRAIGVTYDRKAKHIHPDLMGKRRIKLFGRENFKSLPIEKVIIGPSSNQDAHYEEVQSILSQTNIKIQKSKTPYIEQSITKIAKARSRP